MPGTTFKQQRAIRFWIMNYVDLAKEPITLRTIANRLREETGFDVPASTVARILRDEGYEYQSAEWKKDDK